MALSSTKLPGNCPNPEKPIGVLIEFHKANRFLPYIAMVGVGIGTANYFINEGLNWIQWVIQSLATSFLIGYPLVLAAANKATFKSYFKQPWQLYLCLLVLCFLLGAITSEIEQVLQATVFHRGPYQAFSAGSMYLFNGIIATVLGFSFFQNDAIFQPIQEDREPEAEAATAPALESTTVAPITKIPVKQGDNIRLVPIQEIVYFEAFDNYAFLYTLTGEKKLCDYSLLFLEQRLDESFVRIHRKYIINTNHVQEIRPHLNGRYLILFTGETLDSITSSKSYATAIRRLIKIE